METAGEFYVSYGRKKEVKLESSDEKLQGSEHEVIDQPLQDYSYLGKKSMLTHIGNTTSRDWKDQKQLRVTSPSLTWIKNWSCDQYCSRNFWDLMSREVLSH